MLDEVTTVAWQGATGPHCQRIRAYPRAYEDFARVVVPDLQRRGLFHREYAGTTLRENLGLLRPARGDWAG